MVIHKKCVAVRASVMVGFILAATDNTAIAQQSTSLPAAICAANTFGLGGAQLQAMPCLPTSVPSSTALANSSTRLQTFQFYYFEISGPSNLSMNVSFDYYLYAGRSNSGIALPDGSVGLTGVASADTTIIVFDRQVGPFVYDPSTRLLFSDTVVAPSSSTCGSGGCAVVPGTRETFGHKTTSLLLNTNTIYTIELATGAESSGNGAIGLAYADPIISFNTAMYQTFAVRLSPGLDNVVDTSGFVPLSAVPEPKALLLAATGLAAIGWLRRREASMTPSA